MYKQQACDCTKLLYTKRAHWLAHPCKEPCKVVPASESSWYMQLQHGERLLSETETHVSVYAVAIKLLKAALPQNPTLHPMQLLHSCSKQPCLKSPPCVSCTCCTTAQSSEQSSLSNLLSTPCSDCTAAHSSKQFCLSNPPCIPCSDCTGNPASATNLAFSCSDCSAAQISLASRTHLAFHAVIAHPLKFKDPPCIPRSDCTAAQTQEPTLHSTQ